MGLLVGDITRLFEKVANTHWRRLKYPKLLQSVVDLYLRNLRGGYPLKLELGCARALWSLPVPALQLALAVSAIVCILHTWKKSQDPKIDCLYPAMKSPALFCNCNTGCFYLCPERTPLYLAGTGSHCFVLSCWLQEALQSITTSELD